MKLLSDWYASWKKDCYQESYDRGYEDGKSSKPKTPPQEGKGTVCRINKEAKKKGQKQ